MRVINTIFSLLMLGLVACNSSSTTNVEVIETTGATETAQATAAVDNSNSSNVSSNSSTSVSPTVATINTSSSSSSGCLPSNELRQQMLALINQARSQSRSCGGQLFNAAGAVSWNTRLEAAAQKHSNDMSANNFFSHEGSNGSVFSDRAQNEGYFWRTIAENISAGRSSPSAVVEGWLNSAGHCGNIMNPTYAEMGVACSANHNSEFGVYYTQMLGTQ